MGPFSSSYLSGSRYPAYLVEAGQGKPTEDWFERENHSKTLLRLTQLLTGQIPRGYRVLYIFFVIMNGAGDKLWQRRKCGQYFSTSTFRFAGVLELETTVDIFIAKGVKSSKNDGS